ERKYNIVCLTETHHHWERIYIDDKLDNFSSMREERNRENNIKKGGGLKILMEKNKSSEFEKKRSESREILEIEGKCFGITLKIILVYFDVDKGEIGRQNNEEIRKEIEEKIRNNKSKGLIILGDFNAHLEMIEPERKDDFNGKMIIEWVEKYNLILLNTDEKCIGKYTRSRGVQKSAIDMVLVNEEMYETCKDMRIDEEKEIISFSDHNLVSVTLRLGEKGRKTFETGKWTEDVFLKRDKKSVKENGEELERRWTENESRNVNDMISKMQEVQDILLIKKVKRKIGGEDNKEIECNWMTDEIRREISKKRDIRKKLRRCENETEKERLTSIEDNQKIKIQLMVKEAKEVEEKKIEKEIRNSDNKGKMIWNLINKIRGKRIIPEEDEIFKNGLKMETEEARKCFFGDWRGILAVRENKAHEIWDEEIKKEMIESRDNIDTRMWIEEHLDMASR
ncbi:unnamed protein product, partial [Meganyctiphanes norvegica]